MKPEGDKQLLITAVLIFIFFAVMLSLIGVIIYFSPKQEDIAVESVKAYTGCNKVVLLSKTKFYNGNAYLIDVCGKEERFILYNDGHLLPR